MKAVFLDRVSVLSEYDTEVHSPSRAMRLPSVIALKDYIPAARRPAFTRFNVFLRDAFSCQYCGERHPTHDLTFDHVIPRSRGGRTTWENVVTACGACNLRKGSKLPRECHMHPRLVPAQPSTWELQENGRAFPPNFLHESWARLPVLGQRVGQLTQPCTGWHQLRPMPMDQVRHHRSDVPQWEGEVPLAVQPVPAYARNGFVGCQGVGRDQAILPAAPQAGRHLDLHRGRSPSPPHRCARPKARREPRAATLHATRRSARHATTG